MHFIETVFGFGKKVFAKKYHLCVHYCNLVYDNSIGIYKSKLDIDDERDPLYTKDELLWSTYKILDGWVTRIWVSIGNAQISNIYPVLIRIYSIPWNSSDKPGTQQTEMAMW